jgi:hypothetical protein
MHSFERTKLVMIAEEFSREGRDPQLYCPFGQWLFPVINPSGAMMAKQMCFLISRGEGDRAPAFTGEFPTKHLEFVFLGRGWYVVALEVPYNVEAAEFRKILEQGEDTLNTKGTQL